MSLVSYGSKMEKMDGFGYSLGRHRSRLQLRQWSLWIMGMVIQSRRQRACLACMHACMRRPLRGMTDKQRPRALLGVTKGLAPAPQSQRGREEGPPS